MKIALCQTNPIIGDFEYNVSLIKKGACEARRQGCALAVFPELSLMGYPAKDLLEKDDFVKENLLQLQRLSAEIDGIAVLCGFVDKNPVRTGKRLINGAALIVDRKVVGTGGKRLLPTYDVFDETRYFEPGQRSLVFELEGRKWGVTICEDIWNAVEGLMGSPRYEVDPVPDLVAQGVEVLVNLSASPYSLNKGAVRLRLLQELTRKYRIPIAYCNQVGGNDDLLFDGSSMVVDREGRLIRLGKEFASDMVVWDMEADYEALTDPWPTEDESVLNGLIIGTRDYTTKCGFKSALVGLSGGIDSSLVACIACEALGAENVMGVSMPSPYTSTMSKEDATSLGKNLGMHVVEIPIHDLFEGFKRTLASFFAGRGEDHTEENIQARIRGNLLMALSNKYGSLLLTTGNKSEFAMGYCTLYGDLSGGLAVISDIPKTLCYRLARHINKREEIIPHRVLTRPPSAELRPDQTDQDSLPPYEMLDEILYAAVVENRGCAEIVERGYEPSVVEDVLRRLARNEYKRRQAPPGLKITTKAFGHGRRYPIARGARVF